MGTYIVIQAGEVVQVWGDIPLMTAAFFLLFTNLSLSLKIFNLVLKRETIRTIVNNCEQELICEKRETGKKIIARFNRQARLQLFTYIALAAGTVLGWAASAEKNQLPLRAWYPYDTTQSPAYDLTYIHQCVAVGLSATVNVSVDTVVTSLVALCCCRLQLLALSLQTLFDDLPLQTTGLLHPSVEPVAWDRLRECIQQHQTTLKATVFLQRCFSLPVLAQFTVSVFIICATAYQLSVETANFIRTASMIFYLVVMMYQVFVYCYQGNEIQVESEAVCDAAYVSEWLVCTPRMRRALVLLMTRTRCPVILSAGGLVNLSLKTFMGIIKASYTFFTVLQGAGNGTK
ncbi:odorant receptor Or1-like [Pieris napi]|uniref:odorant receptor Or1-like n=1 Tax=Pieris napi TaxID=78633 RepID=UPI001FBB96CD|nr:odorant receptor Or1-like [Pieris napi]